MEKPSLGFWRIWNMSFGFFGIQIAFALQNANVSRIFQSLGADTGSLAVYWLAAPLTGLLVQPIIGHFSDRTWIFGGRRRPYFLVGAVLTTLALFVMPHAPALWFAAVMLWLLDASINISMEPFRAFVGDMLPNRQRTHGFAMQTVFIGAGAVLGSAAPWMLSAWFGVSDATDAAVPANVIAAFGLGGVVLLGSILWTVVTSREYAPEELAKFREPPSLFRSEEDIEGVAPASAAGLVRAGVGFLIAGVVATAGVVRWEGDKQLYILAGGLVVLGVFFVARAVMKRLNSGDNFFSHIIDDLTTMPTVMRRLAVVQFFSWFGLFIMWVYSTPAITSFHYGAVEVGSDLYNRGADWVGVLFGVYNGAAALYAFFLPAIAERIGKRGAHIVNLLIGAGALVSMMVIRDPAMLWIAMLGVGVAWASILAMPYAILSECLPPKKMGIYMGIFNFFIVLPQITVVGVMSTVLVGLFGGPASAGGDAIVGSEVIWVYPMAAASFVLAAAAMVFVQARAAAPAVAPAQQT